MERTPTSRTSTSKESRRGTARGASERNLRGARRFWGWAIALLVIVTLAIWLLWGFRWPPTADVAATATDARGAVATAASRLAGEPPATDPAYAPARPKQAWCCGNAGSWLS